MNSATGNAGKTLPVGIVSLLTVRQRMLNYQSRCRPPSIRLLRFQALGKRKRFADPVVNAIHRLQILLAAIGKASVNDYQFIIGMGLRDDGGKSPFEAGKVVAGNGNNTDAVSVDVHTFSVFSVLPRV